MRDFKGKIAVVTGASMGLGRALAEQALKEGVRAVVLADIQEEALARTAAALQALGLGEVLAIPMDASKLEDVQRLLDATLERFGAVHLAFFNAGVGGNAGSFTILGADVAKWRWVDNVNFWGVLYGCKLFGRAMVAQAKRDGTEGHIVNTSSLAGITRGFLGAYSTSKHGVVAITEGLMSEFQALDLYPRALGVSALCPGFVDTNIFDQGKYAESDVHLSDSERAKEAAVFANAPDMISAADAAVLVFDGIRNQDLYILTHPDMSEMLVKDRAKEILAKKAPPLIQYSRDRLLGRLGQTLESRL